MRVAIVGAGGLVGTEFTCQLSRVQQVMPFAHRDLDITDDKAISRTIFNERPELIINCAVLGVDPCEQEPSLARAVNVTGAEALAKATAAINAEFVQISTNHVFGGRREGDAFYTVEDVPTAISVYGQTKLAGEYAVKLAVSRCFIVRSSWIFGAGKDNFFSTAPRSLNEALL